MNRAVALPVLLVLATLLTLASPQSSEARFRRRHQCDSCTGPCGVPCWVSWINICDAKDREFTCWCCKGGSWGHCKDGCDPFALSVFKSGTEPPAMDCDQRYKGGAACCERCPCYRFAMACGCDCRLRYATPDEVKAGAFDAYYAIEHLGARCKMHK